MDGFFDNVNEYVKDNAGLYLAMGGIAALQRQENHAARSSAERKQLNAALDKLEREKAETVSARRLLVMVEPVLEDAAEIPVYQIAHDCGWDVEFWTELVTEQENCLETIEDMKFFQSLKRKATLLGERMRPLCERYDRLVSALRTCFNKSIEGKGDIFDIFYFAAINGEDYFIEQVSRGFTAELNALLIEGRESDEVSFLFQKAAQAVIPHDTIKVDVESKRAKLNEEIIALASEVTSVDNGSFRGRFFTFNAKKSFMSRELVMETKKDLRLLIDFDLYGTAFSKEVARLRSGLKAKELKAGGQLRYFEKLNDVNLWL